MLSVGFVCEFDPLARKSWSGIHYTQFKMLQRRYRVEWLNPDSLQLKLLLKVWARVSRFTGKNLAWMNTIFYSKYLGWNVRRRLQNKKIDLLFFPVGSAALAFLQTDIPLIYQSDTTFSLLVDYYRDYTELTKQNSNSGNLLEQRALQKAKRSIFASEWARQSAIKDYGIDPEKVLMFPLTPNLETIPTTAELRYSKSGSLNLLFVGIDWKRKGGTKVIKIYQLLKRRYPNCRLRLVGGVPSESIDDPGIEIFGFIDKNSPEGSAKLSSMYLDTDFFILPTQAELAGVVFAEASGFAVPSLTYNTGGTGQYVENNVNGFIFSPETDETAFSDAIASVYDDPVKYQALRKSTRRKYEQEFSQERWLDRFNKMLLDIGIAE